MSRAHYWNLVLYQTWADLRVEARRYYISYVWWILEPLLEMGVFYLVFAVLLERGGPNFVQFLLVGLVAWKWFGTTSQHCCNALTGAKGLINRAALPKVIFPTVVILRDTFKAGIAMLMVWGFVVASGFPPNTAYHALPVILLTQLLLVAAVGYVLAAAVPFVPDLTFLVTLILRMVFFLSGVFFSPERIPPEYQTYFFLNPVARLIDDYRGVLLHGQWPEWEPLLVIALASLLVILFAVRLMRRFETSYPRILSR